MLGLGLGLLLASLVMLVQGGRPLPPERVEQLARKMGMVYPQEVVTYDGQTSLPQIQGNEGKVVMVE